MRHRLRAPRPEPGPPRSRGSRPCKRSSASPSSGFGLGALYSLASQGLMVIYRGSGVLNFAHGAIGMVGAYVEWELDVKHGQAFVAWRWSPGSPCRAAIGALTHLLIMRQLRRGVAARPHRRHARRADHAAGRAPCCATARRPTFVASELPDDVCAIPSGHRHLGRPVHPARHRRRRSAWRCGRSTATPGSAWPPPRWPRTSARRVARAVARLHRHRQLGARLGARRPGRDPDRPDRPAPGRDHDEPRARRHWPPRSSPASARSRSPSSPACRSASARPS